MTKEQLAEILNGREYREEITRGEEATAKENGLVVVFGASDDLTEFRGAITDEGGAFGGGEILLDTDGLFVECDSGCEYSEAAKEKCKTIKAIWGEGRFSWQYDTTIPHAKFEILEDGETYCEGIVFDINDLK